MTAEVARRDRARANFDALLAYKREGERRRIPDVIREIWAERQWEPLGFKSYGEACVSILGPEWRNPWSIEDRREVVADLRGSGMSTRAIASAVGVSDGTVRTDLDQLRSSAQQPDPVTGLDGKSYPATRPTVAAITPDEPRPNKEPAAPRRKPLPDSFFAAGYDLARKAVALHNLTADPRWSRNAEQVARYRNDLLRTRDLIDQVISALPIQGEG